MRLKHPHWHLTHRGLVRLDGPDAVSFVQRMSSQDVRPLAASGQARLTLFLNAKGRLIDEVQVISQDGSLMLETAPHRAQALVHWLDGYTIMEQLSYTVVSEAAPQLTVIVSPQKNDTGALAPVQAVLQSLGFAALPGPQQAVRSESLGAWATRARPAFGTGVTLTAGQQPEGTLLCDALQGAFGPGLTQEQEAVWRLSTGVATPEADYPTPAPPFELRLGQDSIHWHKGCYIGQEVISRLEAYDKVARLMMGVRIDGGVHGLTGTVGDMRILVNGAVVGKINRVVADATGLNLVGLGTVKRDFAKAQPVQFVDATGAQAQGMLFDCPQWQR